MFSALYCASFPIYSPHSGATGRYIYNMQQRFRALNNDAPSFEACTGLHLTEYSFGSEPPKKRLLTELTVTLSCVTTASPTRERQRQRSVSYTHLTLPT